LEAEIERIKAQIEMLLQMKEGFSERITEFSERIGELRMALSEHEKEASQILDRALQTVEMVKELRPEELMVHFKRSEAKLDALRARIESGEVMMEKLRERLSAMSRDIAQIRGIGELLKLSQEIRKELREAKHVEAKIAKHADRVESIFGEMQTLFGKLDHCEKALKDVEETTHELIEDVEKLKVGVQASIRRDELAKLRKGVDRRLARISRLAETLRQRHSELETIITSSKRLSIATERIRREVRQIERAHQRLDIVEKRIERLRKLVQLARVLDARLARLGERLKVFAKKDQLEVIKMTVDRKLLLLEAEREKMGKMLKEWAAESRRVRRELKKEYKEVKRAVSKVGLERLRRRIERVERRQKRILGLLETLIE
jgi:chromosome segregation ATPase